MNDRLKALALLLALSVLPAMAQDYVIKVNGIVCEFCALGVSKKVCRLPFIDPSKYDKGVLVDIENQLVTMAVKPGAKLDQNLLFDAKLRRTSVVRGIGFFAAFALPILQFD